MMETTTTDILLNKYLNNQCSREEIEKALPIIIDLESNEKYNDIWFHHWVKCMATDVDFKLNNDTPEIPKVAKTIKLNILKYAAIFIILISMGYFASKLFITSEPNFTQTELAVNGTQKDIVLEDGSSVTLLGGSQIEIAESFDKSRDVKLKGEAVFNVQHNKDIPFEVHTSDLNIKVIGTKFNVRAFDSEPLIMVTVSSGKVGIDIDNIKESEKIFLTPNMQLIYNKETQQYSIKQVESKKYTKKKNKHLYFNDTPLYMVINDLQRIYEVNISVNDSTILNNLMTGEHTNHTLDEVLKSLCFINNLSYKMINDKHIIIETAKTK